MNSLSSVEHRINRTMTLPPPSMETDEASHPLPPKSWDRPPLILVFVIWVMACMFGVPFYLKIRETTNAMDACSHCRHILVSLKSYASEHEGRYPDGATSNDAFRELFKGGYASQESLFTAANSPYIGDDQIGDLPERAKALMPGENHWSMTKGLKDDSSGNAPLIFENPAVASWPPLWDAQAIGVPKPGRIWKNHTIVIARNDGSVAPEKLVGDKPLVSLEKNSRGHDLFTQAGHLEILDVAK